MANARLKQARRRAVARHANGPPSTATSTAHPPPRAPAAPNEPVSDAQRERAAIEAALAERKRALEAKLQALTLGKPLSKEVLPGCDGTGRRVTRCHRDYLLQEMEWMAADFQQERKWRARSAKALSQALVSHLDRQEARAARQARSALVAQRRVAARVGREVKKFWSKIDKIIAFKVKLEADDVRARQMEQHLKQLVAQTETYATALATSFHDEEEDGAFEVEDEEEDDEGSIEEDEKVHGIRSRQEVADEVTALQEESELSMDELRARYGIETKEKDQDEKVAGESEDGEFQLDAEEEDDEDDEASIEEDEKVPGIRSRQEVADEVAALQEESELSMDELRARDRGIETRDERANADAVVARTSSVARKSGYKRPYLLTSRLELRAYQEAGVQWLIRMCDRRINGILADEMGLGKTIQTITLLAHLACAHGLWGPHLIVVPTSCLVNWEMEVKRWCPAFKVLTYFGSAKRRKELRQGWSKQNAFHVCITSYQLVVQDAHCFKRKKWYYLILDEAHHIKNWKSLRWQTLLTFSSQRRLLLTGTPLQNNLLELWALMHFLMPHVFASRKEFSYWFQTPLAQMVENGQHASEDESKKELVTQLHGIIRPFVLRRLKKEVAKQLPAKFEHVLTCPLSKRQRFLYEDFISRSSTRRALTGRPNGRSANFMSMMNVLMQLRKVCNHPDLFEPRPIASPLDLPRLDLSLPCRCGYLTDDVINERPRVAYWTERNFPGLEVAQVDKWTSRRRRHLFVDDVSAPLPQCTASVIPDEYKDKKDVVARLVALARKRHEYWTMKRRTTTQLAKLQNELRLDEPVYGAALRRACTMPMLISLAMEIHRYRTKGRQDERVEPTGALQTMVRDPEERLEAMQPVVNKCMCYVPRARAKPARVLYDSGRFVYDDTFVLSRAARAHELVRTCVYPMARRLLAPYDDAFKRTQLFFPDKALVQFDCGKFQQLAVLLRTLKRGHHRCLIFTQMSSMLNLLEVFLNLHGHTYFRLDGATQVDKRQRLMERFNRDDKIFCFILSTRSGGLGINLTGADTVIFYDSDWNPAMDAQAQDRAHRIGQTRDVHIYRLVSEHTVEENILRKAQQKRQLDSLVLAEGQFTTEFFSKASLRELMQREMVEEQENDDDEEVSVETVEKAMAQLEDEEDVVAMKDARAEYLREQHEFDEDGGTVASSPREAGDVGSRPSTPSSMSVSTVASERDDDDDESEEDAPTRRKRARSNEPEPTKKRVKLQVPARDKVREEARDAAEEQKLQAWKASVQSLQHFEDSLNPVDRYALHFREDIDPLYAYTPASNSSVATDPTASTLLDEIAKIEAEKRLDEARLIDDGELIHGQLDARDYSALYRRERARVLFEQRKRQVSGEAWTIRKCAKTQQPFYFNVDTREATWECPAVRRANDEIQRARRRGYAGFPSLALVRVLALIRPYPDRYQAQLVCRNWYQAAQHPSLFVKLSASDAAFATTLTHVARGETVVFGPGVYPLDKIVEISTNVRLLAAPDAHVELQMRSSRAQLRWRARGGVICGFHFTRSSDWKRDEMKARVDAAQHKTSKKRDKKLANWQHLLSVVGRGHVRVEYCEFDGKGRGNACICVWGRTKRTKKKTTTAPSKTLLVLQNCVIRGAGSSGVLLVRGSLVMVWNTVESNGHAGVTIVGGHALLKRNRIQRNARFGVRLFYHAGHVMIEDNVLAAHPCGHVDVENSGRRFVVRWNVVDKGPPESTPRPHAHGTVRVQTYRVVEKSVPLPLPVPVCQTMTNATTEYWKRHFASLMRPMLFPAGASSALPVAPFTMAMTTSVSGKPTIPSITFPRTGGPSPAGTSGGPTFHRTASAPDVANGAPPSDKGLETMARQEMVLRDTCEKPVEKVVKPRRPKDGATPGVVPSSSSLEGQEKGAMGGTALPATTASDKMMETSASVATAETSASVETAETSASVETAEKKEEDAGEAKG